MIPETPQEVIMDALISSFIDDSQFMTPMTVRDIALLASKLYATMEVNGYKIYKTANCKKIAYTKMREISLPGRKQDIHGKSSKRSVVCTTD